MPYYFAIINSHDNPVYEAEFSSLNSSFPPELKELNPFIIHSSLDILDDLQWQMNSNVGFLRSRNAENIDNCYLGKIDYFYGLVITGYLTYGNLKFVMIHGSNNGGSSNITVEDSMIRHFYQEVHELYIKTLMNPFYKVGDPIFSPTFDGKVRLLAKKYLTK